MDPARREPSEAKRPHISRLCSVRFCYNLDFMIFRFKNKANIAKYELILPLFIKFYSGLLCIMMPFFRRFRGGYYDMGFLMIF